VQNCTVGSDVNEDDFVGGLVIQGIQAIVLGLVFGVSASAQEAKAVGEKVYVEQKCSICHSVAGKGNAKGSLDEVGSKLSPDEIRAWITDAKGMTVKTRAPRKPEMKAYTLPKDEVDGLVTYLSGLKKK
jgi:mono/diheme cytochrome c family protein